MSDPLTPAEQAAALDAAEAGAAAREGRTPAKRMAKKAEASKTETEATGGNYRVVNCGASYCLPEQPNSRRFALKGEIIQLDPGEAERLRDLGSVVGEDEPDPEPGPSTERAVPQESQEAHAAKAKAAKAKGSK